MRVEPQTSASKLTDRGSSHAWCVAISKLSTRAFLLPLALLLLVPFSYLSPTSALAVGDANKATCSPETESSPGFRSYLPDCRAYELVSPVYGAGSVAARGNSGAPVVSSSGEEVMALSFGAFAG